MWGQETSGAPMSSLGRITIPRDKSFSEKFSNGGIFSSFPACQLQDLKHSCVYSVPVNMGTVVLNQGRGSWY